jgi:glyoxylase-like metal-dependent hydrolase (beta-lactamase superfamily II)
MGTSIQGPSEECSEMLHGSGIERIAVPVQFLMRCTNVYLINGSCPTLIDVPPNDDDSISHLCAGLSLSGLALTDIKRIVLTHNHLDHSGAAERIAALSGAEIWAAKETARYLRTFPEELDLDLDYYEGVLRLFGFPEGHDTVELFRQASRKYGCRVEVTRELDENDEVRLGSTVFRVASVPGHTPGCILLVEPGKRFAFSGDFLFQEVSCPAVLQRTDKDQRKYGGLESYISSLKKVRTMGLETAFPGHGEAVERVPARIDSILSFLMRRHTRVFELIRQHPRSTLELVTILCGNVAGDALIISISEVLGYLGMLEDERKIERIDYNSGIVWQCRRE